MNPCSYCEQTFDTQDKLDTHLCQEHRGDLTRLDKRRLKEAGKLEQDGREITETQILIGLIFVLFAGVFAFGFFVILTPENPDGTTQPTGHGTVHYHGPITATVDGEQIDFSKRKYQLQSDGFHFENNNGDKWHIHAQDVTLKYALGTVGFNVSENGDRVRFNGKTYEESSETVEILVNGEEVNPSEYILQKNDKITIKLD